MRVETYGQSRPQEGRQQTQNQDAYVIGQGPVPYVALCDGAGNAQGVAKRALSLLQAFLKEATLGEVLREETWIRWTKSLDSALLGGAETTLVAAAVLGNQVAGVVVGDSRSYVVPLDGPTELVTSKASKARLGSGEADRYRFSALMCDESRRRHSAKWATAMKTGSSRAWWCVFASWRPMPLLKVREPFDHPDWLFELKHDGFRALAVVQGHRCHLVSRRGHVFKQWPQLDRELAHTVKAGRAVLDGEVACLRPDGSSDFNALLFRRDWPVFYAFDLLQLDERDLRGEPLRTRKRLLGGWCRMATGRTVRKRKPPSTGTAELATRGWLPAALEVVHGSRLVP